MFVSCHEVWESEHSSPKRIVTGPYKVLDAVPRADGCQIAQFNMIHATLAQMRSVNESKVIAALRDQPGLTRPQLAKITVISTITVGTIVDKLEKDGIIRVLPPLTKRGQPAIRFELIGE